MIALTMSGRRSRSTSHTFAARTGNPPASWSMSASAVIMIVLLPTARLVDLAREHQRHTLPVFAVQAPLHRPERRAVLLLQHRDLADKRPRFLLQLPHRPSASGRVSMPKR